MIVPELGVPAFDTFAFQYKGPATGRKLRRKEGEKNRKLTFMNSRTFFAIQHCTYIAGRATVLEISPMVPKAVAVSVSGNTIATMLPCRTAIISPLTSTEPPNCQLVAKVVVTLTSALAVPAWEESKRQRDAKNKAEALRAFMIASVCLLDEEVRGLCREEGMKCDERS